ncbi:MAG: SlyX family protein [Polyangiaceae bacterium]|nr:SlyX family protein [Polyangiaceae bacterium]
MTDDPRFIFLETKFAYQDKLLAELNEALISQQKQLDTVLARVHALESQWKNNSSAGELPPNEAPPHY